MFTLSFSILNNRADAEEIVQDTFVRAHRALADVPADCSLPAWLARIATRLARTRYPSMADLIAPQEPGSDGKILESKFYPIVAECVNRLPPQQREILAMRVTECWSYEEISRELGIDPDAVKSRIARARETLRILICKTCPDFAPAIKPSAAGPE